MDLWQSELRVSWRAQCLSLLLHGSVVLLLLLAPWPVNYTPLWLLLLILTLLESVRSQRRIRRRCGTLSWQSGRQWYWREQRWQRQAAPWITPWMILLTLRNSGGQRERLWLFADAMSAAEWRLLRQRLLMPEGEK